MSSLCSHFTEDLRRGDSALGAKAPASAFAIDAIYDERHLQDDDGMPGNTDPDAAR